MKKLIYISFIFAFVLVFASCEKEVIEPFMNADVTTRVVDGSEDPGIYSTGGNRGGEDDHTTTVTDPDEDEDFDGDDNIVDPDEDEDFDEDEDGK